MTLNILILAAARDRDESAEDYPFCLTEINGKLLIERISESLSNITNASYYCAILQDEDRRFRLSEVFHQLFPSISITKVAASTKGAACTALLAVVRMEGNAPLLIVSSNEFINLDLQVAIQEFGSRHLDAGTLTFRSLHPRYSYVRLSENGYVEEAAQHRPISQHATAGIFWFARTLDFVDAAKNLIRKDASDNGRFFIAPTLNELVLKQLNVGIYPIPKECYFPLKNESQRKRFEERSSETL